MRIAQKLYENGFITYMRTDSVTLSPASIEATRAAAKSLYGAEYVSDAVRVYAGKSKNAQEAHEAIRPTDFSRSSAGGGDHARLYELIWKRALASQMASMRII